MESVYAFIRSITPAGFSPRQYLQFLCVVVVGVLSVALLA